MPESSKVLINELDLAHSTQTAPYGVMAVLGTTKRGLINNPKHIIKSWPEFVKHFGGLSDTSDFPLLCKRALERGTALRVARIVNYADINVNTPSAALATIKTTFSMQFDNTNLKAGDDIDITINAVTAATIPFTISHTYTMGLIANMIKTYYSLVADAVVLKNPTPGANPRTIIVGFKTGAAAITQFDIIVTGTGTVPVVTDTEITGITNSAAAALLTITPIERGAEYNKLLVYVLPPSNKKAAFFDLTVTLIGEPDSTETYKNLEIKAVANKNLQTGLTKLRESTLINFNNPDLSAVTDLSPLSGIYGFKSGTDGNAVASTDFIGSSVTKTGLQAFNDYGDMSVIVAPERGIQDVGFTQAGQAYVENRKDLVFFAHIDNSFTTEATINAAIDACTLDSSYVGLYGGGLKVNDPVSGIEKEISEMGDIMGLVAYTHKNFGTNYSFAGRNRGLIYNTTGPITNFGEIGKKEDLEYLAANRANMVVLTDNRIFLKGNFTAQVALSPLSFMSIRFLLIDIKKTLRPTLENYIEEPNEPSTWLKLYHEVKPYLKSLSDKKALQGIEGIGWDWQGDQYVTNMADLLVNNAPDVQLGRYKVKLFVKPVNSIQVIELTIVVTPGGVSFEEALALI